MPFPHVSGQGLSEMVEFLPDAPILALCRHRVTAGPAGSGTGHSLLPVQVGPRLYPTLPSNLRTWLSSLGRPLASACSLQDQLVRQSL